MDFLKSLKKRAADNPKTIVLPESDDLRILQATEIILRDNLAKVILLGSRPKIEKRAKELNLDISSVEVVDPNHDLFMEEYVEMYYVLRKHKHITIEDARNALKDLTTFGVMMVYSGRADGLVAGATQPTAKTLRPALQVIKTKPHVPLASSFFFMETAQGNVYFFSDCAFVINPDVHELAYIALETAISAQNFGFKPVVAMLSFSTKGSAKDPLADKVVNATQLVKKLRPDLRVDGELQLDAAIVPEISKKKCPDSVVKGNANILIFPDLNSGNIGYKLVQRFAKAKAIGPIVQGLAKPVNDLSRGCSVDDIVDVVTITVIEAQE